MDCSSFSSVAVTNTLSKSNTGEARVYSHHSSRLQTSRGSQAETQAASYSTSAIKVRGKKCVYLLAFLTLTYFGTQLEKGAARSGLNQLTIKTIPSQTCPQTNLILTTPQLRLSFQVILGCALYIEPIQMVSHGSPTNVPSNLRLSTSILEAGIWEQSSTDILIEDIKR